MTIYICHINVCNLYLLFVKNFVVGRYVMCVGSYVGVCWQWHMDMLDGSMVLAGIDGMDNISDLAALLINYKVVILILLWIVIQ